MAFIDAEGEGHIRTSEFFRLTKMKGELERIEAQSRGIKHADRMVVDLDMLERQTSASAALVAALNTVRRTKTSGELPAVDHRIGSVEDANAAHMMEALFTRFGADGDGFHNVKETQELAL